MKAFCENCRDMVDYTTSIHQFTKQIKCHVLTYDGQIAECNDCHHELFVSEVRDQNLKLLDQAYKQDYQV